VVFLREGRLSNTKGLPPPGKHSRGSVIVLVRTRKKGGNRRSRTKPMLTLRGGERATPSARQRAEKVRESAPVKRDRGTATRRLSGEKNDPGESSRGGGGWLPILPGGSKRSLVLRKRHRRAEEKEGRSKSLGQKNLSSNHPSKGKTLTYISFLTKKGGGSGCERAENDSHGRGPFFASGDNLGKKLQKGSYLLTCRKGKNSFVGGRRADYFEKRASAFLSK